MPFCLRIEHQAPMFSERPCVQMSLISLGTTVAFANCVISSMYTIVLRVAIMSRKYFSHCPSHSKGWKIYTANLGLNSPVNHGLSTVPRPFSANLYVLPR